MVTTTTRLPGSRKLLFRSERHLLYFTPSPDGPLVLKVPVGDSPRERDLLSLQNELAATRDLQIPGVRRGLRVEREGGRFAVALAYAPGDALVPRAAQTRADLRATLDIAIRLSRIVGALHRAGVIHENLQPSHVLRDAGTQDITVIGMRHAARVDLKQSHLAGPKNLRGTLAYMSPEQTGRMNRVVDYRADLYSLGVTFYELFTGRLPFDSADPMELVHCHIARTPLPANTVNPALPSALALVIAKLLAKSADERYQSAFGLAHDLERSLASLHDTGTIELFPLAERDRSGRFRMPHKLYGREAQAAALCGAFERASAGRAELCLVTGSSGVGKSALVHEVLRSLGEKRGTFAEGKFEQLLRNTPYHALVQAFRGILARVLTEDDTALAAFRARILPVISGLGKVLTDLVPTLEIVLGEQPDVPDLGGEEMQNRFLRALTLFVQALAPAEHPLVLFLDDLQWADSASLDLLSALLTDSRTRNVLFVCAYRDQEVTPSHPLARFIEKIHKASVPVESIHLDCLAPDDVRALTADALQADPEKIEPLAAIVSDKTGGNAFFVGQLLKALCAEGILTFDHDDQTWHYQLADVRRAATSADVLELMAERLRRLPAAARRTLQVAASVGARFDIDTLAAASGEPPGAVARDLWPSVEAGLIRPDSDVFPLAGAEADSIAEVTGELSFAHDRVQQAAYTSVPEADRKAIHLQIGRVLWRRTPKGPEAGKVFDVVNHLNAGIDLVTSPDERLRIAELNLRAGQAARASVAFLQAVEYFSTGQRLLGPSPWHDHYELMLALRGGEAEAASVGGDIARGSEAAREVLSNARAPRDKATAYHALQTAARIRDKLDESLAVGLEALEHYGVRFPRNPGGHHIGIEMLRVRYLLRGRSIDSLADAPEMTDPAAIAAMRMMDRICVTAFRAGSKLYPMLLLRQLALTLEHGNMDLSPAVFASYAIALCGLLGDIDTGTKFGNMALRLQHRYPEERLWRRVDYIWGTFLGHWSRPLTETFPLIHGATMARLDLGEAFNAGFCAFTESA
ncbi:MAG: serine/threonine-protein kinase PknK, partial [Polyangiaceae bacterium]